jgi:hypothetical protein
MSASLPVATPGVRRTTRTLTAIDTTQDQPSPIPATNGHVPNVIGRTQTMFSPVKAIIAGALVFALGGMFLIAQPFSQQGSVPSAEQTVEPVAPVMVTSETTGLLCQPEPTPEVDGPVSRTYGLTCEVLKEWSDPRLEGTDTYVENSTSYDLADGDTLAMFSKVHDIVTDEGAWRMRPDLRFEFPGTPDISDFPEWWVLDGEGAYAGLSLLLFTTPDEPLNGYIIASDLLPPPPERTPTQ